MFEVHAVVEVEGPILSGQAPGILDDLTEAAVDAVAEQGFRDLHFTMRRVFKEPTGFYWSQLRDRPISATAHVLYDNRVVYGPWLEGTGSRNAPVTKFSGYWSFRRVAQHLDKKSGTILAPVLRDYVGRLS